MWVFPVPGGPWTKAILDVKQCLIASSWDSSKLFLKQSGKIFSLGLIKILSYINAEVSLISKLSKFTLTISFSNGNCFITKFCNLFNI